MPVISDFLFADADALIRRAVAPERRARHLPADGRRALRLRAAVGVGRLDRGVRRRERPDARAVAARAAPAGRRASATGRTRSSGWRATRISTSCASASIGGRWKRRWSSSPPSGGSGRCDEQDQGFSNHSRVGVVLVGHVLLDVPLHAQTPAPQRRRRGRAVVVPQGSPPPPRPAAPARRPSRRARAKPGEVESDPIRCWWKADRTAVRVGERFGLVLTCSVIETGPITVVPVLNQLEPGALSLTPFEVVSGVRHDDVVVPPWRYIQCEYAVRLLSDGFFGQDVTIPALTVTYNLQERGAGSQGRDQTYILPALPMRILSLVPKSADDIRDASGQTFASIESRRFRASLATTTAWIVVRVRRAVRHLRAGARGRRSSASKNRRASSSRCRPRRCCGASLSALARVKDDASQAGLDVGAVAPRRRGAAHRRRRRAGPSGQRRASSAPDATERDGQLTVYAGWPRRRRVLLSAATTSRTIATGAEQRPRPDARRRAPTSSRSPTRSGVLNTAGYGRQSEGGSVGARQRAGRRARRRCAASARRHAVAATHGARR